MTEYLGLGGLALVAFSMAALWISRMNSNAATPAAIADLEDHVEPVRHSPPPSQLQFKLTPEVVVEDAAPVQEIATELEATRQTAVVQAPVESPRPQQQKDSESAFEQLKIAESLSLIGDFEGTQEYANLVLSDKTASDRQRAQAEILLRKASPL